MRKKFLILCLLVFAASWAYADENTDQAWQEFTKKDFVKARAAIQKCQLKSKKAGLKQQKELRSLKSKRKADVEALFSAVVSAQEDKDVPGFNHILSKKELNDTATAQFIEAEMLLAEKKTNEAKKHYQEIMDNYEDAYCWDPRGWYWKVSDVARDRIETMGTGHDYGDYKSETLMAKAWKALEDKDTKSVELYSNKCIKLYERRAQKMKAKVKEDPQEGKESENWAMNDVATAYYLLGEKLLAEGKNDEARKMYEKAIEHKFALCWNPKGWYFKIAEAAQDRLDTMGTKYNYEDYRSARLVTKAWKALEEKDYKGVELYTKKCIHLFRKKALLMNVTVKSFPEPGKEHENWALNDVAASYFILGNRFAAEAKFDLAKEMYEKAKFFTYAVCWNPLGWYFKIGEAVQDKLTTLGTKYDYADYKSETLVKNAWQMFAENDAYGLELYLRKCLYLYEPEALKMKEAVKDFPTAGQENINWAMNDVATCYYLLGEQRRKENKAAEAQTMYNKAKEFSYSVCWNPQGWYFKVAEAAQDRLDTMGTPYDYEDYKSVTLTTKAWKALESKDYFGVNLYAQKCIHLFEKEAEKMNQTLTTAPTPGNEAQNWALNDVATCYLLLGDKLAAENKPEEAKAMYAKAKTFTYALCWNPIGWYFNVADTAQDRLDLMGTSYSYGDYKSETLTTKAWESLKFNDFQGAALYATKCIRLYNQQAATMENAFIAKTLTEANSTNWALNDVATSYVILGETCRLTNDTVNAKKWYEQAKKLTHAVCWDTRGWYFNVAELAQDKIDNIGTPYDYEDYSSKTLTKKAWDSLKVKDSKGIELYANKCIKLYEAKAKEMHAQVQSAPAKGEEHLNWAINDVATCYYLLGEMYLLNNADQQAKEMYQKATEFGFALCWDPEGWYFKVAEAAQDKLDLSGTSYSYGNYRSVTLTNKAWKALTSRDYRGVELFTKKCIYLYEQKARDMQRELTDYANSNFAAYYWALNDVGTCYFILGESYKQQGETVKAQEAYSAVKNQLYYAQCWDPRGWYWKVSLVSEDRLREMQ